MGKLGKKRAWESRESGSDSEGERERDRQAKEEFEERLKARDEARTRHIAEARLSKSELEVGNLFVTIWGQGLAGECRTMQCNTCNRACSCAQ